MNCGEHATEFWQALDVTLGGCISVFELDPMATSLLIKLRSRIIAMNPQAAVQLDAAHAFARLSVMARPTKLGHLQNVQFRAVVKPLGLSVNDADLAFKCLDYHGGNDQAGQASITVKDIDWLLRLPSLVDIEAVMLHNCAEETEALRNLTWARARQTKRAGMFKGSKEESSARRVRSEGPSEGSVSKSGRTDAMVRAGSARSNARRGTFFDDNGSDDDPSRKVWSNRSRGGERYKPRFSVDVGTPDQATRRGPPDKDTSPRSGGRGGDATTAEQEEGEDKDEVDEVDETDELDHVAKNAGEADDTH